MSIAIGDAHVRTIDVACFRVVYRSVLAFSPGMERNQEGNPIEWQIVGEEKLVILGVKK